MKINLAYIISALLAVGLVALGFTVFQISDERAKLNEDIKSRCSLIADEFSKLSASHIAADQDYLIQVSDSLSRNHKILGIAICYNDYRIAPLNQAVKPYLSYSSDYIPQAVKADSSFGIFFKADNRNLYQFIKPLTGNQYNENAIILYTDAEYIRENIKSILITNFLRWFIQVLLMLVATTLLIRWGIFKPINKIVRWITAIKDGNTEIINEKSPVKFLDPLHKEIKNIAHAMQEARSVAEEEARLRTLGEAIWTPDRLREEVRKLMPDKKIIVVSNREPYMHVHAGKEIKCIVPASGLVTAMEPILKACGGLWIATASGDADKETVDQSDKISVPPGEEKYILKRIWITKKEEDHFYYGFSNEGIWPLCHLAHTRPVFREEDWEYYKKVNLKFAKSVLEEMKDLDQPFILIQDYHFALLPELIKKERPDAITAIFWHIPWPNPESFSICPWQSEILRGMLGADLIGFHTQYHCNNFLETVNNTLDSRVKWDNFSVKIGDMTTLVRSFPISIAFTLKDYDFKDEIVRKPEEILAPYNIKSQFMGIGVERIDYTKGIAEKFKAIELFLEKNPSYIGRFTFVQIGAPSRTLLKSYSDVIVSVESEADRINQKFKVKDWKPVLLLMRHHSHQEILPFYKAASLCMVTSLHDGMNLVAKEFVASRNNNDGVLILSRFAGAIQELKGAIKVNPYDTGEMADAIKTALEMPVKTQVRRMQQMRQYIVEHNIYSWASGLLRTMVSIES